MRDEELIRAPKGEDSTRAMVILPCFCCIIVERLTLLDSRMEKDEILEQPTQSDRHSCLVSSQLTWIFLIPIGSIVVLSLSGWWLVFAWTIISVSVTAALPWSYRFHVAAAT